MADPKEDRDDKSTAGLVGGAFAGGTVGGVAGGAIAGASAGGLGGPAGAAIGAAVGAVAGAIGGKAIADRVNPGAEHDHWKTHYSSQPYVAQGATYDDYGPAYKLGYERYPDYHGRTFEQSEPELQRDWDAARGSSRLAWTDARHATRDAFNRVRDNLAAGAAGAASIAGAAADTTTTGESGANVVKSLNKLLRDELAATETYRQGLDEIRDEYANDVRFQQLAQIHRDHEQAAGDLRELVRELGGTPSDESGAWGAWSNTVMGTARMLGDRASLSALLAGERSGFDDYQDALKDDSTPDRARHSIRMLLSKTQEHIQQLELMIDAT